MLDLIVKWLSDHSPLFLAGALFFWLGWKIKALYLRFQKTEKACSQIEIILVQLDHRLQKTETECGKIETVLIPALIIITQKIQSNEVSIEKLNRQMEVINRQMEAINRHIEIIYEKIESIQNNFFVLIAFLATKHDDFPFDLLKSKSPFQLSDLGIEVLEAIGGKKYVDDNLSYLLAMMEKETFKSALDVEIFSKTILIKELTSDGFTPIKNYLFNNPYYEKEERKIRLSLESAIHLIGIYLRDKYFEKHPALLLV